MGVQGMLLKARVLSRAEFLPLVPISDESLDWRVMRREAAFALACRITASRNEFLPLDAVMMRLADTLACELGGRAAAVRVAAAVVLEAWDLCLKLVIAAESDPRLYREIIPGDQQQFLAIGLKDGAPPMIQAGLMADCIARLGACQQVRGVSIQAVLRGVRAAAQRHNIDLPSQFTVDPRHRDFPTWCEEIVEHQRAALARDKKRKVKGRKITRPPPSTASAIRMALT